jgi:hypothetical protein
MVLLPAGVPVVLFTAVLKHAAWKMMGILAFPLRY